jgi:hypothetical protein
MLSRQPAAAGGIATGRHSPGRGDLIHLRLSTEMITELLNIIVISCNSRLHIATYKWLNGEMANCGNVTSKPLT